MVRFTDYLKYTSANADDASQTSQSNFNIGGVEDFKKNEKKYKPKLVLELRGERSLLSAEDALQIPLTFNCIQCLILQALIGKKAPESLTWCKFFNRNFISNVTLVIIDGWDLTDLHSIITNWDEPPEKKIRMSQEDVNCENNLNSNQDEKKFSSMEVVEAGLPFTSSCFPLKFQTEEAFQYSDEPVVELFSCIPMSPIVVSAVKEKYRSLKRAAKAHVISPAPYENEEIKPKEKFASLVENHKDKFNRLNLLLSAPEMVKFCYPLGLDGTTSLEDQQYAPLHSSYDKVTRTSPMFGIDCEMCTTVVGTELTRISVVDEKLNVLYSSFVKPSNAIIDYLTRYSGVTPDHLLNVTTSLTQVQQKLREILPKDCILVGHSLENDLIALKLIHPYCIDTSLIYNLSYNVYSKPSLRLLAKLFLNRDIQKGDIKGHDPSEDAAASLELVLLKLRNDISFGDVKKGGALPCSKNSYIMALKKSRAESYYSFNSAKTAFGENYVSSVPKIIKLEPDNKSFVVTNDAEAKDYLESYGSDCCQITQRFDEVLETEPEAHKNFKFIVRHCQVPDTSSKSRRRLRKNLSKIDEKLMALHETMPENSLILTLFTKKSDLSVPKEYRPKGLLLLDFKGQDCKSFYRS